MAPNHSIVKFEASISGELYSLLERAAQFRGISMADFVFNAAREVAEETIEPITLGDLKTQIIRLSPEDQKFIADTFINPPPLSPAMKKAMKRHKELVRSDSR